MPKTVLDIRPGSLRAPRREEWMCDACGELFGEDDLVVRGGFFAPGDRAIICLACHQTYGDHNSIDREDARATIEAIIHEYGEYKKRWEEMTTPPGPIIRGHYPVEQVMLRPADRSKRHPLPILACRRVREDGSVRWVIKEGTCYLADDGLYIYPASDGEVPTWPTLDEAIAAWLAHGGKGSEDQ